MRILGRLFLCSIVLIIGTEPAYADGIPILPVLNPSQFQEREGFSLYDLFLYTGAILSPWKPSSSSD